MLNVLSTVRFLFDTEAGVCVVGVCDTHLCGYRYTVRCRPHPTEVIANIRIEIQYLNQPYTRGVYRVQTE